MCDGCDGGFHISCVVRELQKEEEECDRLPAPGDGDKRDARERTTGNEKSEDDDFANDAAQNAADDDDENENENVSIETNERR